MGSALACTLAFCGAAVAQPSGAPQDALTVAVQKAITVNPEVTARLNAFRAGAAETDVVRGAWRPRVDADANVGWSRDGFDNRNPGSQNLSRSGVGVTVRQLLWDGYATRGEVSRLEHLRHARYFEFVDVTEQTALEAARAWYDVLRFRRLVELAEDNYVQHRLAHDQIESRVKAGVGRRVDLEQAAARLALAQSNLGVEVANLHDVTARYQRVVGDTPPAGKELGITLKEGIPARLADTLAQATTRNAAIAAAVENLRAVSAQAEGQSSSYKPRVEARARAAAGNNLGGSADQRSEMTAEITLSWNLYNGGSDDARARQLASLMTQAADNRDRSCRDVRQTAAIAFNDTGKLQDQIVHLERNMLAIARARDAYRQQFDIGQRSLLDLLNAENEVYTAKRSLANAEVDLRVAYVRTQAAMNTLSSGLGLARLDASIEPDADTSAAATTRCPVLDSAPTVMSLRELDARAQALAAARQTTAVSTGAAPAASPAAPRQ